MRPAPSQPFAPQNLDPPLSQVPLQQAKRPQNNNNNNKYREMRWRLHLFWSTAPRVS